MTAATASISAITILNKVDARMGNGPIVLPVPHHSCPTILHFWRRNAKGAELGETGYQLNLTHKWVELETSLNGIPRFTKYKPGKALY
jgi:hypothetical protein